MSTDLYRTTITISRKDRRSVRRILSTIEEKYEFPIDIKDSHFYAAMHKLVIEAGTPELILNEAKENNLNEEDTIALQSAYGFILDQLAKKLYDEVLTRIENDERRTK